MENLVIEGTSSTPAITCNVNGKIDISGRSLPENPIAFFKPLFDWSNQYQNSGIEINIKLEYFNTSTSKIIMDFLNIFSTKGLDEGVKINWFYEEGDEDNLESGQIYQDIYGAFKFDFIEYAEM